MQKQKNLDEFQKKFRVTELSLAQYEHWVLSLRPQQLTLGSMVLSVKGNFCNFSELSHESVSEMGVGFVDAEKAAKEAFGAVRINILCLMLQDPLIHFHIIPRYDTDQRFFDRTWHDQDWPKPPMMRATQTDDLSLDAIFRQMSESRHFATDFKA